VLCVNSLGKPDPKLLYFLINTILTVISVFWFNCNHHNSTSR